MWPYHPDLLATPVPRYTSFPTAAEFGTSVGPADFAEAVSAAKGDISLYLHIPFCEKICWYCGCNTAAANRPQRLASYLDALHREIETVAALLPASARIRRVAFGGGSPNAIPPVEFTRLFDQLALHMPLHDPIVSIELDPRSLNAHWREVIRGVGATHASLGVQTIAPHLQEAIGRVQPVCTIDRSVRLLREAGITSLNFDLMYGLPGQTMSDLAQSLALAQSYQADRIALFGYAHVPHLLPRQRRIDGHALPGQELRFRMAEAGYAKLRAGGYQAVGFDHFALPADPLAKAANSGALRRNFQGFTDDPSTALIGLGASAISSFPGVLVQNEKNAGRYRMLLSQNRLATSGGKRRDANDFKRALLIEDLLCRGRAAPDPAMTSAAMDRLLPYLERGLATISDGVLQISGDGLPYSRSIAASFDPYRQHSPRRFSSAI